VDLVSAAKTDLPLAIASKTIFDISSGSFSSVFNASESASAIDECSESAILKS
jgi:hypothetical protein